MAVTLFGSGTQTCSVGTEHFVSSPNAAGTYVFVIDSNPFASGDVFELRASMPVLTGGTVRVAYYVRYEGAQATDDKIKISVPVATDLSESNAIRFSIKQTEGSSRDIIWKVMQLDG